MAATAKKGRAKPASVVPILTQEDERPLLDRRLYIPDSMQAAFVQVAHCQADYEDYRRQALVSINNLMEYKNDHKAMVYEATERLIAAGAGKTEAGKMLHKDVELSDFEGGLTAAELLDRKAQSDLSLARNRLNTARLFALGFLPGAVALGDNHNGV